MAIEQNRHPATSEPRVIAGRFELGEVLGNGGMATVYRAWDRDGGQPCAVKVPAENLATDDDLRRRFRQEAGAAGALVHPRIVRVYAHGEDATTPYLAMEHIDGGTLRDLFRRQGQLPEPLAVRLAAEVAEALAYAHERGVIHRDIKPHNILLTGDRHVKVADFGIARTLGNTSHTKTGSVLGSTQYISPEQARGDQAGPAADQYALGVVLYEALAGRLPFQEAETPIAMALKHITEPPFDLQWLRPDLSEPTVTLVRKLLAKSPQDRYPTAAHLAAALRRIYVRFGREDSANAATAVLPLSLGDRAASPRAGDTGVLRRMEPRRRRSSREDIAAALGPGAAVSLASLRGHATRREHTARTPALSASRRGEGPAPRVALAVISLLGLWMIAGAAYQASRSVPGSPLPHPAPQAAAQVRVPSLIGQTLDAAQHPATVQPFTVAVASSRQDPSAAAGLIIAQDPPADTTMAQGATIHVVVSQGSGVVPDLHGVSPADAGKQLAAAGLTVGGTRQAADDAVAAGMIVTESPAASTHLAPHAPVDIVVSQGPGNAAGAGVQPADVAPAVTQAPPSSAPPGNAAPTANSGPSSAAPAPSAALSPAFAAAPAQPTAIVPNVTGTQIDRAQAQLRAARLRVGQVNYTHNTEVASGVVIYQARVAGSWAPANEAVDLLVSQGPAGAPNQTP